MLTSLPMYILQMGIRLVVKFDRTTIDTVNPPKTTPMDSRIQGIVFCTIMCLLAAALYW